MSKLSNVFLFAIIYFLVSSFSFATENHVIFFDQKKNPIDIHQKNDSLKVAYYGKHVVVDIKSKKILTKMDAISIISNKAFLINSNQFFWAFIRVPSKKSQGTGYCGAGFEDFIYLFKINKKNLTHIDNFQAQSCLDNFSIGVNSIDDVKEYIFLSPENFNLEISQEKFSEEKIVSKKIRLKANPSKIEVQALEDK